MSSRVAVDIGGTFTDVAAFREETGELLYGKSLSTPARLVEGISHGVEKANATFAEADIFLHGSTIAINTMLERSGARTALITGNLTFHGVTKPVTLKASYNAGGVNPLDKATTIGFNATADIKRSDFGVKTYVPLIGDDVALRISAAFVMKK